MEQSSEWNEIRMPKILTFIFLRLILFSIVNSTVIYFKAAWNDIFFYKS